MDGFNEDADAQTIIEVERVATFDRGTEQTSNNSIKVCTLTTPHWVSYLHSYQQTLLLLLRKFCPL